MLLERHYIQQPDFSFLKYCERQFNINRGVYNTIDAWFYDQGEKDILRRRKKMIAFLHFATQKHVDKVRFGKGGLTNKLLEFSRK